MSKKIANEDEGNKEKKVCVICMTNPIEWILAPCGHKCLCTECGKIYNKTRDGLNWKEKRIYNSEGYWYPYWMYYHRGSLNKGKIHCSCGMCTAKTKNKGKRRRISWDPVRNYKISELKKIQQMIWDEKNWEQEIYEIKKDENFEKEFGWLKNKYSEEEYEYLKN